VSGKEAVCVELLKRSCVCEYACACVRGARARARVNTYKNLYKILSEKS